MDFLWVILMIFHIIFIVTSLLIFSGLSAKALKKILSDYNKERRKDNHNS